MVAPSIPLNGKEKKASTKRDKPKFLRTDWHKKIRLGKGVKKNQKWHGAKGRQNKLRLGRKGRMQRPKIGWGADAKTKDFIDGINTILVKNVKDMDAVKKGYGVIIAKVGAKKKAEIIAKANEMKIKILNKYKKEVSISRNNPNKLQEGTK